MAFLKKQAGGIALTAVLAVAAMFISSWIPYHLISGGVFALLIGMLLNPLVARYAVFRGGIKLVSKQVLRLAIILMGLTLSFSQVLQVGGFSLIVMSFTLLAAFGGGYLLGKLFGMDWKLSSLISAGTGICGGSAIAAIAPTIEDACENADVVMGLRIQRERQQKGLFPSVAEYCDHWEITPQRLALAKKNALVMHPGPMNRGVEIASSVADCGQSVITQQVESGVAVRMALLYMLTRRENV